MSTYREVLRGPGVLPVMTAQLVARLPAGMLGIAVLLHIESVTGSYASGGAVVAILAVGQALAGPVSGRAVGRWGARRVLLTTVACSTVSIVLLAAAPTLVPAQPFAAMLALAFLAGATTPPIQSVARTLYPLLVDARGVVPLLSLDASLQEVIFVVAPVAVTAIAAAYGPVVALAVVASVLLGGGVWLAATREVGQMAMPRSARRIGRVALQLPVTVGIVLGILLVGASMIVEVAVVAAFEVEPLNAGILLALYSLSSLVGGLAAGRARVGRWSLARRMGVVATGLVLCAAAAGFWAPAVGLLIAGLGVAPAFTVSYLLVSFTVPPDAMAEAFGWLGAGALVGSAAGSAIGGIVVDGFGAPAAFLMAALFAFLGAALAALVSGRLPEPGAAAAT